MKSSRQTAVDSGRQTSINRGRARQVLISNICVVSSLKTNSRLRSSSILIDWLTENGLKGRAGVEMPEAVVVETARKYKEAYEILVGKGWDETLKSTSV